MSQFIFIDFQRFLVTIGEYTRQACDTHMGFELFVDDEAWECFCELALNGNEQNWRGPLPLAILKDSYADYIREQDAALMRLEVFPGLEERVHLLGLGRLLLKSRRHSRHRPHSAYTSAMRDAVAHFVIVAGILHPDWPMKARVACAQEHFRVKRSYVFQALKMLAPERRARMEAGARALNKPRALNEWIKDLRRS